MSDDIECGFVFSLMHSKVLTCIRVSHATIPVVSLSDLTRGAVA